MTTVRSPRRGPTPRLSPGFDRLAHHLRHARGRVHGGTERRSSALEATAFLDDHDHLNAQRPNGADVNSRHPFGAGSPRTTQNAAVGVSGGHGSSSGLVGEESDHGPYVLRTRHASCNPRSGPPAGGRRSGPAGSVDVRRSSSAACGRRSGRKPRICRYRAGIRTSGGESPGRQDRRLPDGRKEPLPRVRGRIRIGLRGPGRHVRQDRRFKDTLRPAVVSGIRARILGRGPGNAVVDENWANLTDQSRMRLDQLMDLKAAKDEPPHGIASASRFASRRSSLRIRNGPVRKFPHGMRQRGGCRTLVDSPRQSRHRQAVSDCRLRLSQLLGVGIGQVLALLRRSRGRER
jgi:hypothetical protein